MRESSRLRTRYRSGFLNLRKWNCQPATPHRCESVNFREATWIDAAGRQWLRTGDLGRRDAENFLYIVDRKKDMILSGGQNIYPADIETVMWEHPAVAEVAVVGVSSERWGETPLAVVVLHAGRVMATDELVEWTNARVGKQQRISGVVWRESLPRNPNGKVLKRELRREYSSIGGQAGKPSSMLSRPITSTTAPMVCACTAGCTLHVGRGACRCCVCRV